MMTSALTYSTATDQNYVPARGTEASANAAVQAAVSSHRGGMEFLSPVISVVESAPSHMDFPQASKLEQQTILPRVARHSGGFWTVTLESEG